MLTHKCTNTHNRHTHLQTILIIDNTLTQTDTQNTLNMKTHDYTIMETNKLTNKHSQKQKHTYTHTHIYIHIHTHTHTSTTQTDRYTLINSNDYINRQQ